MQIGTLAFSFFQAMLAKPIASIIGYKSPFFQISATLNKTNPLIV